MKKNYPVTIDGKTYLLRYNYNAVELVEDLTGKSFFEALAVIAKFHMTTIKIVFYAGLKQNHPEIGIDSVGDLLDELGLKESVEVLQQAIENYFLKGKAPANKKPDTKKKIVETTSTIPTEDLTPAE